MGLPDRRDVLEGQGHGREGTARCVAELGPAGVETGVVAVMVLVDGRWLLDDGGLEPQACE